MIEEESDECYVPTPFLANDYEVPRSVPLADCVDTNGKLFLPVLSLTL